MPAEDNQDAIADADALLDTGVQSVSADGHSATADLGLVARRQRERRLRDTDSIELKQVRPVVTRCNLGGAW